MSVYLAALFADDMEPLVRRTAIPCPTLPYCIRGRFAYDTRLDR